MTIGNHINWYPVTLSCGQCSWNQKLRLNQVPEAVASHSEGHVITITTEEDAGHLPLVKYGDFLYSYVCDGGHVPGDENDVPITASDICWWPGGLGYSPGWFCIENCFSDLDDRLDRQWLSYKSYREDVAAPEDTWPGLSEFKAVPDSHPRVVRLCAVCRKYFSPGEMRWHESWQDWVCSSDIPEADYIADDLELLEDEMERTGEEF